MLKKRTIIILLILITLLSYLIYWAFFDMSRLQIGEFMLQKESPDGTYTIKGYVVNGGATVAYSVRCELVFNKSKRNPKNIYWNYREEAISIEWVNNNTVIINGHTLVVPKDTYDFRREK